MMDRDQAYEMASQQGFEGHIFYSDQDAGVGRVDHIKIELEDESGSVSFWYAEVSETNGSESFGAWDRESQDFLERAKAERKAAKKGARTSNA